MSSILENTDVSPSVTASALRLDVEQYRKLCDSGIVPERTELLSGIIVEKMGKSPLHTWTVQFLSDWLRDRLAENRTLRVEQPLTLSMSEPEPDLAIVVGSRDDFRDHHPTTADLIIEVAISTIELDRAKADIYAAADVPEYWLIMPEAREILVYRNPEDGKYTRVESASDELRCGQHALPLANLFPPASGEPR